MARLFAETFAVAPILEETEEPAACYDEARQLNLLPDGTPVVEMRQLGGTVTITEVRAEADDADDPDDVGIFALTTVTKVRTERDDFARSASVATQTGTRIRNEPDDEDRDARMYEGLFSLGTATKTSVREEADDADRNARAHESAAVMDTLTQTFVRAEAEDDDRDDPAAITHDHQSWRTGARSFGPARLIR